MNCPASVFRAFVFLATSLLAATAFAQAVPPTISCSSTPSIFNTASDGVGGALISGNDLNWQFADGGTTALPTPIASLIWQPAVVVSPSVSAWLTAPASSNWIANKASGGSILPSSHLSYYRYDFSLDSQVDPSTFELALDIYADNVLMTIWINDDLFVDYSPTGTGSFTALGRVPVTLKNQGSAQWQTGINTVLVAIRDDGGYEGFLAANGTFAQCTLRSLGQTQAAVPLTNPATLGLLAAGLMLAGARGLFRRRFIRMR